MRYISRALSGTLLQASRQFPAIVLTGPRRAGKTTLLRKLFPKARYLLLEDPDVQARIRSDPRGFVEELKPPVVLDEIQNTPELLAYVRTLIDTGPRRMGQWLFTGSQEAPLMQGITESMAGRAAILNLMPLGLAETNKASLLNGGFPEVLARPQARGLWFASYLQTYLERDVRAITNVRDLVTFRRFLALVASRHGQMVNKSDLATPLGISVPAVGDWLGILEATGQIILVPPFFENLGKRLVKTPKMYVADSGLACHLLGVTSTAELERSPFLGVLFEGFVASEIVKSQANRGLRKEIYYFRDQQGLEVDFVVPRKNSRVWLVEAKASKTVRPAMAVPLLSLGEAMAKAPGRKVQPLVVHRKPRKSVVMASIAPGVEALDVDRFVEELNK